MSNNPQQSSQGNSSKIMSDKVSPLFTALETASHVTENKSPSPPPWCSLTHGPLCLPLFLGLHDPGAFQACPCPWAFAWFFPRSQRAHLLPLSLCLGPTSCLMLQGGLSLPTAAQSALWILLSQLCLLSHSTFNSVTHHIIHLLCFYPLFLPSRTLISAWPEMQL